MNPIAKIGAIIVGGLIGVCLIPLAILMIAPDFFRSLIGRDYNLVKWRRDD